MMADLIFDLLSFIQIYLQNKKYPKGKQNEKILSTENLITIEFQHTPFRINKISKHFHFYRFNATCNFLYQKGKHKTLFTKRILIEKNNFGSEEVLWKNIRIRLQPYYN